MTRRTVAPAARALVLLLAVLASACGKSETRGDAYAGRSSIRVENQAWSDMVVYAYRDSGTRTRLGMVPANSTQVLAIPQSLVGGGVGLRLVADPVGGGGGSYSNEITITPGRMVRWIIPNRR